MGVQACTASEFELKPPKPGTKDRVCAALSTCGPVLNRSLLTSLNCSLLTSLNCFSKWLASKIWI